MIRHSHLNGFCGRIKVMVELKIDRFVDRIFRWIDTGGMIRAA